MPIGVAIVLCIVFFVCGVFLGLVFAAHILVDSLYDDNKDLMIKVWLALERRKAKK